MSAYVLKHETPSVDDFLRLRLSSGLGPKDRVAVERALPNTLFGVSVLHDGAVVGMGRVVGDGGLSFEVRDVAVQPDHQGHGLGAKIMDAIMAYLERNAPPTSFVTLFANPGIPPFYERYGFQTSEPLMTGMHIHVRPRP